MLTVGRCQGPLHESVGGFDNVDRHLIVILERLTGVGRKGFHVMHAITGSGGRIGPEIEAAFVNDAEEPSLKRQSIAAEHGTATQTIELGKLVQDELFESL